MGKQARIVRQQQARANPATKKSTTASQRSPRRWLFAGVLVLIVVVVAAVLAATSGGSPKKSSPGIPAGTQIFTEKNHQHVTGHVQYDRTPPAGGAHNAVWTNCGVYNQVLANEHAVHDLEHGAVWITYQPSLPARQILELQQFVETHYDGPQRYLLLSPYPGIPSPVVASAWGSQIFLHGAADPRLAQFVKHYQGGAQGGEPGSPCTGGIGTPLG